MLEIITQTKICTKCKIEKALKYFYKRKNRPCGVKSFCIECSNIINKKYRHENNEKISTYNKQYSLINKYRLIEYRRVNRKKNAERTKKWTIENKNILSERKKAYRIKNSEYFKSYRIKNKNKLSIYMSQYQKSKIGKISIKNTYHKRRTKTKQGDVTTKQLLELQQSAKVCYWCNASLKNKKVHLDHYTPIVKGGEHTLSNLVISCAKCNQHKSSKDPIIFANSLGRLF